MCVLCGVAWRGVAWRGVNCGCLAGTVCSVIASLCTDTHAKSGYLMEVLVFILSTNYCYLYSC
jgi:hypothetical protein